VRELKKSTASPPIVNSIPSAPTVSNRKPNVTTQPILSQYGNVHGNLGATMVNTEDDSIDFDQASLTNQSCAPTEKSDNDSNKR
jgi:hypothetical protein